MCTLYHAPLILMGLCLGQTTDNEARYHPTQVLVRFKPGTVGNVKQTAHRAGGALRTITQYRILEGLA